MTAQSKNENFIEFDEICNISLLDKFQLYHDILSVHSLLFGISGLLRSAISVALLISYEPKRVEQKKFERRQVQLFRRFKLFSTQIFFLDRTHMSL